MIFVSEANGQLARALGAQGVRVRGADFRRADLMRQALEGIDKALFIPSYDANDLRLRQNLNALEAA